MSKNLVGVKKFKLLICTLLVIVTCTGLFVGCTQKKADKEKEQFTVVSSFYPMHILTMNLVEGIDNVKETSMSEPNIGCIHDHTFSVDDLKKVEGADVYVENGKGLEAFNDKITETYPDLKIVEASADVSSSLYENLHLWTNIDLYMEQIKYVSEQLQAVNPENKEAYKKNEADYIQKLEKLKADYSDKLAKIKGKKVLSLDETMPNLCAYAGLEYIEIETDHEQEALSADDLKESINDMKEKNIKSIFIGKDADRSAAEAIAKETGATIYELNTCMVGTKDSGADSYIEEMKENFEILSTIK